MEDFILYYDGSSARAKKVRVLFLNNQLQIHNIEDPGLIDEISMTGLSINKVGNSFYLYLDNKGMQYLQFPLNNDLAQTLETKVAENNKHWGQNLLKQKSIVLLGLMVFLGIGLYFMLINLIPFFGSRMISVKQEIQMGAQLKRVMLQEASLMGSLVDSVGSRKLQAFGDALKLSNSYPIQITLVKSNIVNAYALPGGQIVVYTGLLEKIKTHEALSALLMHESAHINERHSLKGLLRSAANGILMAVVFNDASGVSGAMVSNANTINGLHYSRSLEIEADSRACALLVENGLDVKGMLELLHILNDLGDLPNELYFLSTHPLTKERIEATKNYKAQHLQKQQERPDLEALFHTLKISLN